MIFRSPYADITIPEVSLTTFVLERARELGEKPALIDGPTGRTITFGELSQLVPSVASGLARRGFQKGEVLAIYSPNVPEFAVVFYAVAMLGGILTTINPVYTVEELAHQISDANAKYLFTIPALLPIALQAKSESAVQEIFVLGQGEGATPFAELIEVMVPPPEVKIDPREDVVVLPYSSGTTGLPKGVMLTHYNLVANLSQFGFFKFSDERHILIGVLPMFHIYGMQVILNSGLQNGATIVTMPRFELEAFLKTLQDYGVTLAHLAPPIIVALAKHPLAAKYDLSKLKYVFSGAAPLGEGITRECCEKLCCTIWQGYGMTESSPVTHSSPYRVEDIKAGSVGTPIPNTECKVIDASNGEELGSDQVGEILVRGPQIMKGYLNLPEATASTVDSEGWLHTGDLGYADEDGHFYIVDRVKELIKYKGLQVAPAEIEAVLLSHPAVAEAAVVPSPDEDAGEVPKAFIVKRGDLTAEEIMAFVAQHVAPYKKIRKVEFVEQIPKTPSGKILRRVLKERERAKL
jgi:acyl-CoA synthetase (AMP-forming)/AMP-acid ligase II